MAAKALNGFQTITDRFVYKPDTIISIRNKKIRRKPGFHTFSNIYLLQKYSSTKLTSLANKNWKQLFEINEINKINYAK